jgi:hypothetical protein
MMTNLDISLKYITHYKTNVLKFIKNKKSLSVYQFFYFFLFLHSLNNNYSTKFKTSKCSIIFFNRTKKLPTFLRAPYKHKKAQISLQSTIYIIYINYYIIYNTKISTNNLVHTIINLFYLWSFFNSPLITLTKYTNVYTVNYSILKKKE